MANVTHFWSGFGRLFSTEKKVETSYSGRLRATAVHGVSSIVTDFFLTVPQEETK